jgi:hypothetical protein
MHIAFITDFYETDCFRNKTRQEINGNSIHPYIFKNAAKLNLLNISKVINTGEYYCCSSTSFQYKTTTPNGFVNWKQNV